MIKELTAAQITNDTLLKLRAQGHRVRRVNNIPHNKRYKGQVDIGAGDIQGYSVNGLHIEVEVKKKGDTLKPAQKERLLDLKKCGGIAMVATYDKLLDIQEFIEQTITR